jgi:hypothetical protein
LILGGGAGPTGATSVDQCGCPAGSTGLTSANCTLCESGKYKSISGSSPCLPCPQGSFSSSLGGISLQTCRCQGGWYGTSGVAPCMGCGIGYRSANQATTCDSCPSGSTTLTANSSASTPCQCQVGYDGPDNGPCRQCGIGLYKGTIGAAACSTCPLLTSTKTVASKLITDCQCIPGTEATVDGVACTSCAINTYKSTNGTGACYACPIGSSTMGLTGTKECTCNAGRKPVYFGVLRLLECPYCSPDNYNPTPGGTCLECPTGHTTDGGIGSISISQCYCRFGYSSSTGYYPCTACSPGKFSDIVSSSNCQSCPIGRYEGSSGNSYCSGICSINSTTLHLGSTSIAECVCQLGYTTGGTSCIGCPIGRYKSVTGSSPCIDCEEDNYSNAVAASSCSSCPLYQSTYGATKQTDISSCSCIAGSCGANGDTCTRCSAGSWKATGGTQCGCTLCEVRILTLLLVLGVVSLISCPYLVAIDWQI